jgi:hypothetical protein
VTKEERKARHKQRMVKRAERREKDHQDRMLYWKGYDRKLQHLLDSAAKAATQKQ